ncbi:hypothetical protein FF38_11176 [Lucilia cuprina]|uniref:Uncharacterized protein n=1 Tax=Lucilia cuprina TaxID=7375 RepID=A0A0L0C416_LUCCU|nr:hypothetical protein FF38_11176 [Lucilia cuprina]
MNSYDWKIVLRPKFSYLNPSDFDVVKSTKNFVQKLSSHPAIKHVSYQSHIKRILSYTTVSNASRLYSKSNTKFVKQNLLKNVPMELSYTLNADILWDRGITGAGIKVAVFDTGLAKNHPHFRNIKERTNWTNEKTLDDGVSHGTFVSGIIASSKECLGIAPDV